LNGSRTFDGNACVTEGNSLVARVTSNGVIEQIERGVYVTFAVSPSGKKDIKRVRFSRKHFGEKEAQHWWEENKGSVYAKYSTEKVRHQLEVTIQSVQE